MILLSWSPCQVQGLGRARVYTTIMYRNRIGRCVPEGGLFFIFQERATPSPRTSDTARRAGGVGGGARRGPVTHRARATQTEPSRPEFSVRAGRRRAPPTARLAARHSQFSRRRVAVLVVVVRPSQRARTVPTHATRTAVRSNTCARRRTPRRDHIYDRRHYPSHARRDRPAYSIKPVSFSFIFEIVEKFFFHYTRLAGYLPV